MRMLHLLLVVSFGLGVVQAEAQEPVKAELFPQSFVVEHQLIERERDGTVYHGEPVRDTYGGSWIVSERPDGSRLLVDLARREMTEIRPAEGIYWTIGFERFAELRSRIARLEGGSTAPQVVTKSGAPAKVEGVPTASLELEVVELQSVAARRAISSKAAQEGMPSLLSAPEIRRYEIKARNAEAGENTGAEVWVDPRLRIGAAAQAALLSFEEDALGATESLGLPPALVMAAVRQKSDGALPVLTVMPVLRRSGAEGESEKVGESEDRVLATSRLEAFPLELARVPEGLVRTSHPLESVLVALEAQAKVDAALAGESQP